MTGERRQYSKIHVPDKWRAFIGSDEIKIEHYDDGMPSSEVPFWTALWSLKRKEEERQNKGAK